MFSEQLKMSINDFLFDLKLELLLSLSYIVDFTLSYSNTCYVIIAVNCT